MRKFSIKVDNVRYAAEFANSVAAVRDAFQRFPGARRVSVRAVK